MTFAPPAGAQTFSQGDLYLLSTSYPTYASAVVRIDPLTGSASLLADIPEVPGFESTLSWDPARGALLTAFVVGGGIGGLAQIDASGTVSYPAPSEVTPSRVAARGDGIVYLWKEGPDTLRYLDAGNVAHDVLDAGGSSIYGLDMNVADMIYDPGTNALFLLGGGGTACPIATEICVAKVPLTVSGAQVAGAETIAQMDISTSGEGVVGAGYLPGGELLVVLDTNSNAQEPRMIAIDPVSVTLSIWASNGSYTGAAATNAGTYSSDRSQAVILDTLNDVLRAFSVAETGLGTQVATGVSSGGSSGEVARLVEIHTAPATPAVPVVGPAGLGVLTVLLGALGSRRMGPTR